MPRRDSGLPRDTQNIMDTCSIRPILYNLQQFKEFDIPSFQELNPDTTEVTRKREDEMKRKSLNTSILSLHFQK